MKIVHIATEVNPFFKTGGLGDVVGALSKSQVQLGHEVFVIMPRFKQMKDKMDSQYWVSNIGFHFNFRFVGAGVYYENYEGVHCFFLENDEYFKRQKAYGETDDLERFGAFSQMAIEMLLERQIDADIIHLHDWQSSMVAPLIRRGYYWNEQLNHARIVQTIHNLQFQGIGNIQLLSDFFQFPITDADVIETMTNNGNTNYLKAGFYYCDKITTVSKTYALEILSNQYGENLNSDLSRLSYKLCGIINGIDIEDYNPEKLWNPYNTQTVNAMKIEYKRDLQEQLGLIVDTQKPLYVAVTRLADQKGWELLAYAARELANRDCQFVLLGTGEAQAEECFHQLTKEYAGSICGYIGFDDRLARHIYAAGDFFLMPSKFEPCGIGQLLAMRYGTIPIVRATGGLVDTVQPFNFYDETGDGLRFNNYDEAAIRWAIDESLRLYQNQEKFKRLRMHDMRRDLSWEKAAREYIDVYESLRV
ncbi:MAG: glycogen synthase [Culicoidibacterales bacterium]